MDLRKFTLKNVFIIWLALVILVLSLAGCSKTETEESEVLSSQQSGKTITTSHDDVSVFFINVGKADAILVQLADNSYLIDTGEKSSVPQLLRALNLFGVEDLKAVFLTHTHSDHIGGMTTLAQYYDIGTLYSAEISEREKDGENKIEKLAQKQLLNHKKLKAGDNVEIAKGICFEVLGPLVYNEDDNDNSLILRLKANERTLLFTGDMQFAEEDTLLNEGVNLAADILKVGNHGNPDATSKKFAAAVSPQYAVISTNTAEDENSANIRVKSALSCSDIHVTQDFECGVHVTVHADGTVTVDNPDVPRSKANIAIESINRNTQTVSIKNNGGYIDISNYFLFSRKGSEVFVFPKGTSLDAGQTVTIAYKNGSADYIWEYEDKPWDKKKDIGILYDRFGCEISRDIAGIG